MLLYPLINLEGVSFDVWMSSQKVASNSKYPKSSLSQSPFGVILAWHTGTPETSYSGVCTPLPLDPTNVYK